MEERDNWYTPMCFSSFFFPRKHLYFQLRIPIRGTQPQPDGCINSSDETHGMSRAFDPSALFVVFYHRRQGLGALVLRRRCSGRFGVDMTPFLEGHQVGECLRLETRGSWLGASCGFCHRHLVRQKKHDGAGSPRNPHQSGWETSPLARRRAQIPRRLGVCIERERSNGYSLQHRRCHACPRCFAFRLQSALCT